MMIDGHRDRSASVSIREATVDSTAPPRYVGVVRRSHADSTALIERTLTEHQVRELVAAGISCPTCGRPQAKPATLMADDERSRYVETLVKLGMEYYVMGRHACGASPFPAIVQGTATGNILHHAIEMFLKAILLKDGVSVDDLKQRYGHHLKRLWKAVKDPALPARFKTTIETLHRFEDIRYPDRIVRDGMTFVAGLHKNEAPRFPPGMSVPPHYEVVITDIDELVIALFDRGPFNPPGYAPFRGGLEVLLHGNSYAERWQRR